MDFQSRINQFRQGLKDQQDAYNSLAQSSAQYGRSIIPDKVAQHLTYMEQVGGMITGASAGLHGAITMGKKIQKWREARRQKNNPTGNQQTQQEDETTKTSREGQQQLSEKEAQEQTEATKTEDISGPTAKGKPSEAFDIGESGGIPRPKAGVEDEDDELDLDTLATERQTERAAVRQGKQPARGETTEEDFGGSVEDALKQSLKEQGGGTDLFSDKTLPQSRGDTATRVEQAEGEVGDDPFAGLDFSAREGMSAGRGVVRGVAGEFDSGQNLGNVIMGSLKPQTGGNVVPKSDTPQKPSGTAEGDASSGKGGAAAEEEELADTGGESGGIVDTISQGVSKVSGAISDASTIAKAGVKDAVSGVIGEVGGEAVASAIPVIGELFGLGMLIRSVIEHHKHEENAPPPKLTAPNPEATEQSGGFSDAMLKGSVQAPSIV